LEELAQSNELALLVLFSLMVFEQWKCRYSARKEMAFLDIPLKHNDIYSHITSTVEMAPLSPSPPPEPLFVQINDSNSRSSNSDDDDNNNKDNNNTTVYAYTMGPDLLNVVNNQLCSELLSALEKAQAKDGYRRGSPTAKRGSVVHRRKLLSYEQLLRISQSVEQTFVLDVLSLSPPPPEQRPVPEQRPGVGSEEFPLLAKRLEAFIKVDAAFSPVVSVAWMQRLRSSQLYAYFSLSAAVTMAVVVAVLPSHMSPVWARGIMAAVGTFFFLVEMTHFDRQLLWQLLMTLDFWLLFVAILRFIVFYQWCLVLHDDGPNSPSAVLISWLTGLIYVWTIVMDAAVGYPIFHKRLSLFLCTANCVRILGTSVLQPHTVCFGTSCMRIDVFAIQALVDLTVFLLFYLYRTIFYPGTFTVLFQRVKVSAECTETPFLRN
jgi:hypothetical protein